MKPYISTTINDFPSGFTSGIESGILSFHYDIENQLLYSVKHDIFVEIYRGCLDVIVPMIENPTHETLQADHETILD